MDNISRDLLLTAAPMSSWILFCFIAGFDGGVQHVLFLHLASGVNNKCAAEGGITPTAGADPGNSGNIPMTSPELHGRDAVGVKGDIGMQGGYLIPSTFFGV